MEERRSATITLLSASFFEPFITLVTVLFVL
jgi:hypothetical protein